jgi:hypothetical protein
LSTSRWPSCAAKYTGVTSLSICVLALQHMSCEVMPSPDVASPKFRRLHWAHVRVPVLPIQILPILLTLQGNKLADYGKWKEERSGTRLSSIMG